ncbi:PREDICTED: uncharacterized protein LOC104599445 isoform X2 [Nelumbo nucifera]|uniref:ETFB lysine methyltransferase n=1 Tax=Nelumbo nucifera TaxID=4432 RepID=A0A1U8A251_NELNU|nr:PREDICTED: uncharacterized protein LOC104599445 isoform X2 [Nelumbo nucifera]
MLMASLRNLLFRRVYTCSTTFYIPSLQLVRPTSALLPSLSTLGHFLPAPRISGQAKEWRCLSPLLASFSTSSEASTNEASASSYLSVRIRCRKDVADMLSDALLCFGASSASMDEPDDCDSTDEISINSIFTECQDVGACISNAAGSIGLKDMPSYVVTMGEHCDWIKKTQESFHPVKISEDLWIVPEWRTPPDAQATNIILNPGLAFGTGDHPTTKLCLVLLYSLIKGGEFFLDYGTGSGILGIAALKLGAALSVGVDVDPQAIRSALQNAALNNVGPQEMQLCLVDSMGNPLSAVGTTDGNVKGQSSHGIRLVAEKEKFDIVMANILLNPLMEMADHIVSYAKPGAVVGVSGILSEQLPQIEGRYMQFLEGMSVSEMDGWACLSGRKRITKYS